MIKPSKGLELWWRGTGRLWLLGLFFSGARAVGDPELLAVLCWLSRELNAKLTSCPLLLQEQEKEARSRAAYISTLPAPPHWGRGFDEDKDEDEGSPGGCNPAGGNGDFHRLVF